MSTATGLIRDHLAVVDSWTPDTTRQESRRRKWRTCRVLADDRMDSEDRTNELTITDRVVCFDKGYSTLLCECFPNFAPDWTE